MTITFSKYQGTGNDFIMLDNRSGRYDNLSLNTIRTLCNRRFGIGADGLIKINAHPTLEFEVDYYNADGSKSFCGNGARCAVQFCQFLGMDVAHPRFMAIDGEHEARIEKDLICLGMADVMQVENFTDDYTLDTGSPHYVRFVDQLATADMVQIGRDVRYSEAFAEKGINVNLVEEIADKHIRIRTYERGVEDETLSCGTGATACAMVYAMRHGLTGEQHIIVEVEGGTLEVAFNRSENNQFTHVWLIGPAEKVFEGGIDD